MLGLVYVSTQLRILYVCLQLHGTFAAQMYKMWGEEAEAALHWVNGMSSARQQCVSAHNLVPKPAHPEEVCRMDHRGKACNFGRTRKDFR